MPDQTPEAEQRQTLGENVTVAGASGFDDVGNAGHEAALSCNCCRKRKLRCSRELPVCQHCRKTGSDCVYETRRAKPGIKAGAIDNLHRRLDALEKRVEEKLPSDAAETDSQTPGSQDGQPDGTPYGILSFFAREFQRFNNSTQPKRLQTVNTNGSHSSQEIEGTSPAKRRRIQDFNFAPQHSSPDQQQAPHPLLAGRHSQHDQELELVLQAYFSHIHPWIPMLHEGRLRRRLSDDAESRELGVVIRAMVLVTARYVQDPDVAASLIQSKEQSEMTRDEIVAVAMRQLSVESCQALIMIAFDDIGSGQAAQAWSIVGALSRNVEYLQLAVEAPLPLNETFPSLCLSQPHISLSGPRDWTEAEERRRIFWNAFNLDRFCSVTMGWNTSLTSDDVNRRLPCDGIQWRKEDEVTTPYFGIWDKATGRIGNPIAFLPSHYAHQSVQQQQQQQSREDDIAPTPTDVSTSPGTGASPSATQIDMSAVGAFAYSIEATESLSRVTSYFLQQKVDMRDQRDLSRWLTRFKELDLRLVHWKMLLPQKWKVDTSRRHSSRMDPGLTLAHVTHNASMILLHQLIAFPLPEWPFKNRLPSLCSADTCQAAAAEIASITENYLKNAPPSLPVASQFAFCLYVASRACLLQWRYGEDDSGGRLAASFWSLLESLDVIARRWAGPHASDDEGSRSAQGNLAGKYASRLKEFYRACSEDPSFKIHVLGYTREVDHRAGVRPSRVREPETQPPLSLSREENQAKRRRTMQTPTATTTFNAGISHFEPSPTSQFPMPLPSAALGSHSANAGTSYNASNNGNSRGSLPNGDLYAISQLLLDQQFVDMDRIISFDDGMFGSGVDGGSW